MMNIDYGYCLTMIAYGHSHRQNDNNNNDNNNSDNNNKYNNDNKTRPPRDKQ